MLGHPSPLLQALLNLTDRVHSAPEYVVSPCGQALLACANDTREAPDAMSLGDTEALEEGVGGAIDGLLATLAYPYPKSIAFSASMDPGGWVWGGLCAQQHCPLPASLWGQC